MIRLRTHRLIAACSIAAFAVSSGRPQQPMSPQASPGTTLRLWGDSGMTSVIEALEQRFAQHHPDIHFQNHLLGTDSAMPALYGGIADLALFGRESNTTENDGFLHSLQYKPLRLRLMNGSLASPGKSYAPVLFVHPGNPLRQLTLSQLDSVLGCESTRQHPPGATWGVLGLGGDWKDKPIHLYILDIESGTGLFVLHKLQGESKKLNWPIIREFSDARHPAGTLYEAPEQTIDALRDDPYGLAVSSLHYADASVRPLALAASVNSGYIAPTAATIVDETYPLARTTYAFVNQPPGQPVPPLAKAFLQFILSPEGQAVIASDAGFLPLSPRVAKQQLDLLNH